MHKRIKLFAEDEDGATAIEYALIASLMSIMIVGVLMLLNGSMVDMFNYIRNSILGAINV